MCKDKLGVFVAGSGIGLAGGLVAGYYLCKNDRFNNKFCDVFRLARDRFGELGKLSNKKK